MSSSSFLPPLQVNVDRQKSERRGGGEGREKSPMLWLMLGCGHLHHPHCCSSQNLLSSSTAATKTHLKGRQPLLLSSSECIFASLWGEINTISTLTVIESTQVTSNTAKTCLVFKLSLVRFVGPKSQMKKELDNKKDKPVNIKKNILTCFASHECYSDYCYAGDSFLCLAFSPALSLCPSLSLSFNLPPTSFYLFLSLENLISSLVPGFVLPSCDKDLCFTSPWETM